MKNKILHNKINETMNNTTISDNQEKCYTSIDNIPDEILDEHIFDFLDEMDWEAINVAQFIAEMQNSDVASLLSRYNLLMNISPKLFLEDAKIFYDMHIIEVMRLVCMWYYSEAFYMLANNLSINTSDIIEMHKLQNKVVDIVWFWLLDFIHTVLYGDEREDWEQTKTSPNEIDNQTPDHICRFRILSFHFHASEYDANFNKDISKEAS